MKRIALLLTINLSLFNLTSAQQVEYLSPQIVDLGRVLAGNVLKDSIRFVNIGTEPIKVIDVKTSCGCTVAGYKEEEILSGDTAAVNFSLNTKGYSSLIRKHITILFEKDTPESKKFYIQANPYQEVDFSPERMTFPRLAVNSDTVVIRYIKLQNNSDSTIQIKSAHTNSDLLRVVLYSVMIPRGKEDSIKVELRPIRNERKWTNIEIDLDYKKSPKISIPVSYRIGK
jgi:hypothetical protein